MHSWQCSFLKGVIKHQLATLHKRCPKVSSSRSFCFLYPSLNPPLECKYVVTNSSFTCFCKKKKEFSKIRNVDCLRWKQFHQMFEKYAAAPPGMGGSPHLETVYLDGKIKPHLRGPPKLLLSVWAPRCREML